MKEIVERLQENRQVELAKSILESAGYKVSKKSRLDESESIDSNWKMIQPYYGSNEKVCARIVSDIHYVIQSSHFDGVDYGEDYVVEVEGGNGKKVYNLQSKNFNQAKKEVDSMFGLSKIDQSSISIHSFDYSRCDTLSPSNSYYDEIKRAIPGASEFYKLDFPEDRELMGKIDRLQSKRKVIGKDIYLYVTPAGESYVQIGRGFCSYYVPKSKVTSTPVRKDSQGDSWDSVNTSDYRLSGIKKNGYELYTQVVDIADADEEEKKYYGIDPNATQAYNILCYDTPDHRDWIDDLCEPIYATEEEAKRAAERYINNH